MNELRAQAATRGVVDRSDRDKVGNQCIITTLENFRVISGKFRYMEFEEFTNMEEEEFLSENSSAGHQGDSSVKLLVGEGGQLSAQSEGHESAFKFKLKQLSENNFDLLAETFVLKEKAHDIVQVCLRESMAQLHQIYMDAMRETPKVGFRSVTFNEVRRLDTVMSKGVFKYLSRGEGPHDDGLYFFLQGDGKNNLIWKLLGSHSEDAPDRGMVGPPASLQVASAVSPQGPSQRAYREFENSPEGLTAAKRATPKPSSSYKRHPGADDRLIGKERVQHEAKVQQEIDDACEVAIEKLDKRKQWKRQCEREFAQAKHSLQVFIDMLNENDPEAHDPWLEYDRHPNLPQNMPIFDTERTKDGPKWVIPSYGIHSR